jgi:hypothetical protein
MTFRGSHLYVNGPEIQGVFGVTSLPLTTVAHIISYVRRSTSLPPRCSTLTLPKSSMATLRPSLDFVGPRAPSIT